MILDDLLFDDQTISASEELGVMIPTDGCNKIIVKAYGEAQFDVYFTPSPDGSHLLAKETLLTDVPANTGDKKVVADVPAWSYITIKNKSVAAAKYSLWVCGI